MNNIDLLKQYVDTGLKIPLYQVQLLSKNLRQTYLRKRMMSVLNSHTNLDYHEYKLVSDDDKKRYIDWIIRRHEDLPVEYLHASSDDVKDFFIETIIKKHDYILRGHYMELPNELKLRYLFYRIDSGKSIDSDFLTVSSPEVVYRYYEYLIKSDKRLENHQYDSLPDELKKLYLERRIANTGSVGDTQYYDMTPDMKKRYIASVKNRQLSSEQLEDTPDEIALFYFRQRLNQGWDLKPDELERFNKLKNGQ